MKMMTHFVIDIRKHFCSLPISFIALLCLFCWLPWRALLFSALLHYIRSFRITVCPRDLIILPYSSFHCRVLYRINGKLYVENGTRPLFQSLYFVHSRTLYYRVFPASHFITSVCTISNGLASCSAKAVYSSVLHLCSSFSHAVYGIHIARARWSGLSPPLDHRCMGLTCHALYQWSRCHPVFNARNALHSASVYCSDPLTRYIAIYFHSTAARYTAPRGMISSETRIFLFPVPSLSTWCYVPRTSRTQSMLTYGPHQYVRAAVSRHGRASKQCSVLWLDVCWYISISGRDYTDWEFMWVFVIEDYVLKKRWISGAVVQET